MKKGLILFTVLMLLSAPLMAMDFFLGASAEADIATYLAYDFSSWADGYHAKLRFPLGISVMMETESLPFAFEIAGGYCPDVAINLNKKENAFPFFVESLFYKRENRYEESNLRTYTGGGLGVYFDEVPVLAGLVDIKWLWTITNHFYANVSCRMDAYFDFLSESDNNALGFVQLGLGIRTGIGVCF